MPKVDFPFIGIPTFCKLPLYSPEEDPPPHVVILGIPYDEGATAHPGARFGPRAIREASTLYPYYKRGRGYFDVEERKKLLTDLEIREGADVAIIPTQREENFHKITQAVRELRNRSILPICLGGDHSITFPILKAFDDTPLHLVQLDAHLDFAASFEGASYTHGSPMRRALELPYVRDLTQIGIRSIISSEEDYQAALDRGNRIFTSRELAALKDYSSITFGDEPLYITLDMDVLDPSQAPGVGYPEPGGLSYLQVKEVLRTLARQKKVVGIDLVEVNPYLDPSRTTALLAARLVLDLLAFIFG